MDGGADWAALFELIKTSPLAVMAVAPTVVSLWLVLRGTKARGEEPARDTQAERMFAALDRIQTAVAKSSGHVEEIERIQQKVYEEMIRQGARRE